MIEHEQYYRKGGTYELPIEIYNDLIGQIEEAQKERNEYKQLYENGLKVNQNTEKYRTELETKYVILQQENERLKEDIRQDKVQFECFELAQECDNRQDKIDLLTNQLKDYKSRCEKAIEYIKMYKCDYYPYELTDSAIRNVLNILNGSDENE